VRSDPPKRSERKAVRDVVTDALEDLVDRVHREAPVRSVASGGTTGALARVLAARRWATPPDSLNGFELDVGEIRDLSRELAALSLRDRLRIPGIDDRRANLLPAGAIILSIAAASLGAATLVHSEWGLREGIVLDELGLADGPVRRPGARRRRSTGSSGSGRGPLARRVDRAGRPRPVRRPPLAARTRRAGAGVARARGLAARCRRPRLARPQPQARGVPRGARGPPRILAGGGCGHRLARPVPEGTAAETGVRAIRGLVAGAPGPRPCARRHPSGGARARAWRRGGCSAGASADLREPGAGATDRH
jgi:hypothetical protein